MKLIVKSSIVIAAGAMLLAGCSGGSSGGSSTAPAPSSSSAPTTSAGPAPTTSAPPSCKPIKVALLTPGTKNDGSWGQAVSTGAQAATDAIGGELTVSENLTENADYETAGNAFAAEGYDLVIVGNASSTDVTNKLAAKYPDTKFGQVGLLDAPLGNETAKLPILWNGSFVAGYLAGLINKSGQVGTIGGFEFPALTSEMEGFALGARYAKNDIKIQRTYINTWTDAAKASAAATAMKAAGAELIFSATDQATQGIFKVMGETPGDYVIPQYNDKHDQAPDVVLTSVLYGLGDITGGFVTDAACDSWTSQSVFTNWGEGMKLAPYYNLETAVPADVQAKVEDMKKQLQDGTIVLPGLDVLGVTGSADTVDLNSLKK